MKKFGDSLLTRSSKVSDLISKLEIELAAKELDEKSSEHKRTEKSGSQFQHILHRTFQLFPLTLRPFCLKLGSKLRAIKNLEIAVEILETQFEAIEATKVEVSDLLDDDTQEQTKKVSDTQRLRVLRMLKVVQILLSI